MATVSPNPEELQQQMRSIRSELGVEVHDLVRNARDMTDWQVYVRRYPWACVGVAAALGYFVVPRAAKKIVPDADSLAQLARDHKIVLETPPAQSRAGLLSRVADLVMGIVIRTGVNALGRQLGPALNQFQKKPAPPQSCEEGCHDQSH